MDPTKLRIGIGHDTHRLQAGGELVLGGVSVPHTHSLVGHSDADVLLHAITDAILGAASLGDIGELFPNTSNENKHRDSAEMLAIAAELEHEVFMLDVQTAFLDAAVEDDFFVEMAVRYQI